MTTLWLDQDAGGWRHKIGDDPVFCGDAIEVRIDGEWIRGRYYRRPLASSAAASGAVIR
jgi:hypothetical protein